MSKPSRLILSPLDKLVEVLLRDNRTTIVYLSDDVCVFECTDRAVVEILKGSGRAWTRIFEEYHIVNANDDKAQGVVVGAFFDWLTEHYNDEIDFTRNLACYEELYGIASHLRDAQSTTTILDVGCGPGTILCSRVAHKTQLLVGYDISNIASQAAASAGMTVITREQFLAGPARFDVALSAYTMHYTCDLAETLAGVQCSLKSGGVWALNFHKDIGLEKFLACLEPSELELAGPIKHSTFGSIVAVIMG